MSPSIVYSFQHYCSVLGRDSYKDVNSLHLPNERYSPVRRASDGMPSLNKHRSHLESLYYQTLSQPGSRHSSLKQLQQEFRQIQVRRLTGKELYP